MPYYFPAKPAPVTLYNMYYGLTSQFMNYPDSIKSGSTFLLLAFGASIAACRAKSLKGRVLAATIALSAAAYGALQISQQIGPFLLKANCFGEELQSCENRAYCTPNMLGGLFVYELTNAEIGSLGSRFNTKDSDCGI